MYRLLVHRCMCAKCVCVWNLDGVTFYGLTYHSVVNQGISVHVCGVMFVGCCLATKVSL